MSNQCPAEGRCLRFFSDQLYGRLFCTFLSQYIKILHRKCGIIMVDTGSKSLVSPILSLVFCSTAYVVYVFSMMQNDKNWVAIAALIYFLPLFIDLIEDFESTNILQKKFFIFTVFCVIIAVIYTIALLSYLTMTEDGVNETPSVAFKIFLSICPIVCIPIKIYPVWLAIMQRYKRQYPQ